MSKKKAVVDFEPEEQYTSAMEDMEFERSLLEHAEFISKTVGMFYLHGEVTAESALGLIQEMERWSVLNALRDDPQPHLTLHINSEGGELAAGLSIHDTLRGLSLTGLHIITGIRGEACSMAAVVSQAGDRRVIGPSSRMMLHQVSSGGAGTTAEIRRQSEHLEATDKTIAELFAKRSGKFSVEWLEQEILDRDRWFTPAEALKVGLVDAIA